MAEIIFASSSFFRSLSPAACAAAGKRLFWGKPLENFEASFLHNVLVALLAAMAAMVATLDHVGGQLEKKMIEMMRRGKEPPPPADSKRASSAL